MDEVWRRARAGFPGASPLERAAHYREQAKRLRELAAAEEIGRFRQRILQIADQYDALAANFETPRL